MVFHQIMERYDIKDQSLDLRNAANRRGICIGFNERGTSKNGTLAGRVHLVRALLADAVQDFDLSAGQYIKLCPRLVLAEENMPGVIAFLRGQLRKGFALIFREGAKTCMSSQSLRFHWHHAPFLSMPHGVFRWKDIQRLFVPQRDDSEELGEMGSSFGCKSETHSNEAAPRQGQSPREEPPQSRPPEEFRPGILDGS